LNELGWREKVGSSDYILAPEIQENRLSTMSPALTKAFTHYWGMLGSQKQVTLKSLRKLYISQISQVTTNPRAVTGHSTEKIMYDHYYDRLSIAKNISKQFKGFSIEEERNESLDTVRQRYEMKNGKEVER